MIPSLSPPPMVWGFPTPRRRDGNRSICRESLAATFLLSTALIANCTAQAQTIGNAGGSKRILVLHIVEVGSAKATSIKKHRWAIAAAKKKVVGRNLVGPTESAAVDVTQCSHQART